MSLGHTVGDGCASFALLPFGSLTVVLPGMRRARARSRPPQRVSPCQQAKLAKRAWAPATAAASAGEAAAAAAALKY